VDQVTGQVRFNKKREKILSIVMMQIFGSDVPEQSRKRQTSLFLGGLGIRINGHFDLSWHHTRINDDFFVKSARVVILSGREELHSGSQ